MTQFKVNYQDKIVRDTHIYLMKYIRSLQKKEGRKVLLRVAQAEAFVLKYQMPPFVESKFNAPTPIAMRLLLANHGEFGLAAKIGILDYANRALEIFKNRDSKSREAFVRLSSIFYFCDALINIMVSRGEVEMTDETKMHFKSHTNAILNFMCDIDRRFTETGVYAMSGNNLQEATEGLNMLSAMLDVVRVSEWYATYQLLLDRFILRKLGSQVDLANPLPDKEEYERLHRTS